MIERQEVEGRGATIAYLDSKMEPAKKAEAVIVKVVFDDGEVMWLVPSEGQSASRT